MQRWPRLPSRVSVWPARCRGDLISDYDGRVRSRLSKGEFLPNTRQSSDTCIIQHITERSNIESTMYGHPWLRYGIEYLLVKYAGWYMCVSDPGNNVYLISDYDGRVRSRLSKGEFLPNTRQSSNIESTMYGHPWLRYGIEYLLVKYAGWYMCHCFA
jgi:hypothetical protein